MTSSAKKPPGRTVPSRLRRRLGAAARMLAALALAGGVYAGVAPSSHAEDGTKPAALNAREQAGKSLYERNCTTCHGPNAEGVKDRGPSLIGVGSAAVEFQVGTGRMPAARQEAQAERKPVMNEFKDPKSIDDLGAYIQYLGGGPQLPKDFKGGDPANGGRLFRMNCSECHGFSAGGGALSSGKFAPALNEATDAQMYAAMLTGPQNMPVFGDNQLTPQEKKDVIAFVDYIHTDRDPGGYGLGRIGPATEGIAIFVIGMVVMIVASLWIAGKS